MEQSKYDVFISYSRKDYVDDRGNVDEKWGFIDTNGVVVVPCQWDVCNAICLWTG